MAKRNRKPTKRGFAKHRTILQAPTKVQPTLSQVEAIRAMNKRLGTSHSVPATEAEARYLIDGLFDEERRKKRAGGVA